MADVTIISKLAVSYDATSDVLYVALGKPVPAETDMDDDGLLVRYAESDGNPCGVTVMGFRSARWACSLDRLTNLVASYLSVPTASVSMAINTLA